MCVDGGHWQQGLPGLSRAKGHAHTEHKAVHQIREMNDTGEMCHFIWNDLQGGPAAISQTRLCLSSPIRLRCCEYPHGWPQWFCAEKKANFSQMTLTVKELKEWLHCVWKSGGPLWKANHEQI